MESTNNEAVGKLSCADKCVPKCNLGTRGTLGRILRCSLVLFLLMTISHLKADEIDVFAAASLTDALKEIAADYEKTSGDKIVFNFEASSALALQIKVGVPADIFFSADEAKMTDLDKDGLVIQETRKDILSNSLVIVVPADSTLTLTSAAQLADAGVKNLAVGQPESVPAGIYAKEYLVKIGVWDKLAAKIVPMENVRAALAAVESGNADAGIVYRTDALHSHKVKVAYEVPVAEGPAIAYPAALLQNSKHRAAAQKFLDYLSTADALKIFSKYGFTTKA